VRCSGFVALLSRQRALLQAVSWTIAGDRASCSMLKQRKAGAASPDLLADGGKLDLVIS
jgi:hypothetical protein